MPVYVTITWVCEVCGRTEEWRRETFPYTDVVIEPPDGEEWEFVMVAGTEQLACPACQAERSR